MKNYKGFTLDISTIYPNCLIEVYFCDSEFTLPDLCEVITGMSDNKRFKTKDFKNTEAAFFAFENLESDDPPNPIGLIIFREPETDPGTYTHELFHAAQYYFKLIGKRISNRKGETFAELLGNLVNTFLIECGKIGIHFS